MFVDVGVGVVLVKGVVLHDVVTGATLTVDIK